MPGYMRYLASGVSLLMSAAAGMTVVIFFEGEGLPAPGQFADRAAFAGYFIAAPGLALAAVALVIYRIVKHTGVVILFCVIEFALGVLLTPMTNF